MKKPVLVILMLLAIASCSKSESHHAKAEELYNRLHWMNERIYSEAVRGFKKSWGETLAKALNDKNNCAHDLAVDLNKDLADTDKMLKSSKEKAVRVIENDFTESELDKINNFYNSNAIGKYISSPDGLQELNNIIESQYGEELAARKQEIPETEHNALYDSYMLKVLPEKDSEAFIAFKDSNEGKKLYTPSKELMGVLEKGADDFYKQGEKISKYPALIADACKTVS